MILFTKPSAILILADKKTVTARLWKSPRAKVGALHYAKTGRRESDRFARLKIKDVWEWCGTINNVTDTIAQAEGFDSPEEFFESYKQLNLHKWEDEDRQHYFIEFEVAEKYNIYKIGY